MIFDSLKRILANLSKSATPDPIKELKANGDVMSGVSVLHNKIKHLNKFRHACDEAGVEGELDKAVLAVDAFAAKSLAFKNARGDLEEVTQAVLSQYEEVTSNLMGLAISANSAGVNLQTEARGVYETVNDLMRTMGLALPSLDACATAQTGAPIAASVPQLLRPPRAPLAVFRRIHCLGIPNRPHERPRSPLERALPSALEEGTPN
jgi:hypothetical protein